MAKKINNNKGADVLVLHDYNDYRAFWMPNGTIIRSLPQLAGALVEMDESSFKYHVNNDNKKNDFAAWIGDVVGDTMLAKRLSRIRSQKKYTEIVAKRVDQLRPN